MLALILRALLAAVFGLAGFAKLSNRAASARSLVDFGVPASLAQPTVVLLATFELVCAVALLPTASAWFGAIGVSAMLVLFIAVIATSLARGRRPACHCFGQLHSAPIGPLTLVRNVALLAAAADIATVGRSQATVAEAVRVAVLASATGWLLALSIASSVTLIFIVFHLLKQNGRLLLRLEAV